MQKYSKRLGFLLIVAIAAIFYFWLPASFPRHIFSEKPEGFYNELTQAFLHRSVSLLREPDSRLIALPDPYDPAANADFRINDLSYYKGRYFLYMGAAPAVDLFLPIKVITGRYLAEDLAPPLLSTIGFAASIALILCLRRRFLPEASWIVVGSSLLAAALADGYYTTARGTMPQQIAIAHAYCCLMLACFALCFAITRVRKKWSGFGVASLFFGLAVASRPNYIISSVSLVALGLYLFRTQKDLSFLERLKCAVAAVLPLTLVVSAILLYNCARFDDMLDFGQRYLLGSWNQISLSTFGLNSARQNVWRYLLAPAFYHRYFPFVFPDAWVAVSVLPHVPWIWLTPAAMWAFLSRKTPVSVRLLGLCVLSVAFLNLFLLIFLQTGNTSTAPTSANARYLVDFLPSWTLAIAIGAVAVSSRLARHHFLGSVWSIFTLGAALASGVVALSLDFGQFPPEAYKPLSAILDLPDYVVEKIEGRRYGPISIDLAFPRNAIGRFDPIVSIGNEKFSELLLVNYPNDHQVRFGVVGTNFQVPLGPPVSIPDSRRVTLQVGIGALFPPVGHPAAMKVSTSGLAYLRRHARVTVDDVLVFDARIPPMDATPEEAVVGQSPYLNGYSEKQFSGTLAGWRRMPMIEPSGARTDSGGYGAISLSLVLPPHPDIGSREPLVCTGIPGAGDIAYIEYLKDGAFDIGVDHWGSKGFKTPPIHSAHEAAHEVTVSMGSLFPANYSPGAHVTISVDGVTEFDGMEDTYSSSPYDVTLGINAIGGSTTRYSFSGKILSSRRAPLSREPSPTKPKIPPS